MSAFVLDDDHIDYLVSAVVAFSHPAGADLDGWTRTDLGRLLLAENDRSVAYCYQEPPSGVAERYEHRPVDAMDPLQTIKVVQCYQYQACEHPGWVGSEAKRITDRLFDRALSRVPGMAEAAWVWQRPARASGPGVDQPAGRLGLRLVDGQASASGTALVR